MRASGLPAVVRCTIARRRVAILVYHDPAPAALDRHLRHVARRHSFVKLDAAVAAIASGDLRRLPPNPVVVTFDDGHRGNAALSGVLARHGVIPAIYLCSAVATTQRHFWFLVAGAEVQALKRLPSRERLAVLARTWGFAPEREHPRRHALDGEEITALRGRVTFASHTRSHPILPTCDEAECREEIVTSRGEIEALVGEPCRHFSYPNGDYGARERALARTAGYASARTIDPGFNGARTDVHALRAVVVPDDASVHRLVGALAGLSRRSLRRPRWALRA